MASHSRAKGKPAARRQAKKAPPAPSQPQRVEDQFKLNVDSIHRAVTAAVDTLPGEPELEDNFVTRMLNGEHPGVRFEDADRVNQAAAHLAASIVTALRPFLG